MINYSLIVFLCIILFIVLSINKKDAFRTKPTQAELDSIKGETFTSFNDAKTRHHWIDAITYEDHRINKFD